MELMQNPGLAKTDSKNAYQRGDRVRIDQHGVSKTGTVVRPTRSMLGPDVLFMAVIVDGEDDPTLLFLDEISPLSEHEEVLDELGLLATKSKIADWLYENDTEFRRETNENIQAASRLPGVSEKDAQILRLAPGVKFLQNRSPDFRL